jgi:hypothetical protein
MTNRIKRSSIMHFIRNLNYLACYLIKSLFLKGEKADCGSRGSSVSPVSPMDCPYPRWIVCIPDPTIRKSYIMETCLGPETAYNGHTFRSSNPIL